MAHNPIPLVVTSSHVSPSTISSPQQRQGRLIGYSSFCRLSSSLFRNASPPQIRVLDCRSGSKSRSGSSNNGRPKLAPKLPGRQPLPKSPNHRTHFLAAPPHTGRTAPTYPELPCLTACHCQAGTTCGSARPYQAKLF